MKQKLITKTTAFYLVISILIIIIANNVCALGIAPSKKIMEYDSQEHTISARIINNEQINTQIKLSVQGPLSEYVIINESILNITNLESEKEFTYKFQLPENMETGTQVINIVASETNPNNNANTISGLLTITHQLQINIPYAKKQLEGYLSIATTTITDPIVTKLTLRNNGIENITKITGILKIFDTNNKTIYTGNIEEQKNILVGESINIDKELKLSNIGTYTAEYDLQYDEKKINITKEFNAGEYNINVLETKVNNFKLGTIAKFDVKLESEWNTVINNVYCELTIKDKNNNIIGQTNNAKSTITPGNNTLTTYWDTLNIVKGEYILNLKIYTDEKILTYEYNMIITDNNIEINSKIKNQEPILNQEIPPKNNDNNFINTIINWYHTTFGFSKK